MREQADDRRILDQDKLDQIHNNENDASTFSPLITLIFLLLSYPFWKTFENAVAIENRSSSFLLSNFSFIFTFIISTLIFKFGPKFISINDRALLQKWEKNNPEYQRIYWMNPFDHYRHLTLGGKLILKIINSLLIGTTIFSSSLSIVVLFIFLAFDSTIKFTVVLVIPVVFLLLWGQIYIMYEEISSATGIYLHKNKIVVRSAFLFRSLPSRSYNTKKFNKIYIKENHSFRYEIPLFYLKFKKNRFTEFTIAYSDDYEEMRELKFKISNYSQIVPQTGS